MNAMSLTSNQLNLILFNTDEVVRVQFTRELLTIWLDENCDAVSACDALFKYCHNEGLDFVLNDYCLNITKPRLRLCNKESGDVTITYGRQVLSCHSTEICYNDIIELFEDVELPLEDIAKLIETSWNFVVGVLK